MIIKTWPPKWIDAAVATGIGYRYLDGSFVTFLGPEFDSLGDFAKAIYELGKADGRAASDAAEAEAEAYK